MEVDPENSETGRRDDAGPDGEGEGNDEFEFPLFSFDPISSKHKDENSDIAQAADGEDGDAEKDVESRGRSKVVKTMKVSLREESEDKIKNERPIDYYFARYSDDIRRQFSQVAVSGQDILNMASTYELTRDWYAYKVLDLNEYNRKVELEQARTQHKRNRPGKKQRENKAKSVERKNQRQKAHKEVEKQKQRALKKKIFHKRGGKKHKKKSEPTPAYRTE